MEKFNYIQDGGKNYLKSEQISNLDYVSKMIIHNEIPSLAAARFKSLNAENYICYNMNGLIPISQSFAMNKLTVERVEGFLRSLIRLYKGMEEFLLPFDRLVVDESYIYENYSKKDEFYWIYGNDTTECSFTALFERLLDRVDYKDDRAVKMMYAMYQTAKDSEDVINKEIGGNTIVKLKEKAEEILSAPSKSLDIRAKELIRLENEKSNFEIESSENSYETREKINMGQQIDNRVNKKSDIKKARMKPIKDNGKKIDVKSKFKKIWEYLNADIGSKPVNEGSMLTVVEEEPSYSIREVQGRTAEQREVVDNPTTLLTGAMVGNGIYCLKPEELNEDNILLTEFPFFIGKSGENTNHRIEDSTVSRFHARIDKEEDELWLTDLNSTNGTFLNGIRMIPYDRVRISKGDSVVISRKRYELRYMG